MRLHQLLTTLGGDRDHQRHHGIKALARPAILRPASRPDGNARAAGGVPSGRAAPRGMFHFGCCRCPLAFVLMWLAALPAQAQFFTNVSFFSGNIALNGDTADFIQADGVSPKPGVCVANDPSGLDESPLNAGNTRDAQNHPTGFNQRRIMTAFDPNLNGATSRQIWLHAPLRCVFRVTAHPPHRGCR